MRAAVLTQFGAPLTVREVPDPEAGGGEVMVEVLAASVAPYAAEVFSGERNYPWPLPSCPESAAWDGSSTWARTPPGCAPATWCGATRPCARGTTP